MTPMRIGLPKFLKSDMANGLLGAVGPKNTWMSSFAVEDGHEIDG